MKLPRHLTRRWVALPALLAGSALLVAAVPRTMASLVSGAGEPIIRHIQNQDEVSAEDLQTIIDAQSSGLFWVHDADLEAKLGLAHLLLAEKLGPQDSVGSIHLEHARQALRSSLGRSPANPYPWTLLAYAEHLQSGSWSEPAVSALRMAILTGPHEPPILWSRLRLGLLAWSALNQEDQEMVLEQVRYAWAQNPKQLIKIVVDLNAATTARAALREDAEATSAFEEMLKAQTSGS